MHKNDCITDNDGVSSIAPLTINRIETEDHRNENMPRRNLIDVLEQQACLTNAPRNEDETPLLTKSNYFLQEPLELARHNRYE